MTFDRSIAESAVSRISLGYAALPENAPLDGKLIVARNIACEAQDPYRKRPIREAGEDLARMIDGYEHSVKVGHSSAIVNGYIDSIGELSDLVADMMIPRTA